MHFIQETGFTLEADQIEPKFPCIDELIRVLEMACLRATVVATHSFGAVQICWKGSTLIAWYCQTGDTIYLRSVT